MAYRVVTEGGDLDGTNSPRGATVVESCPSAQGAEDHVHRHRHHHHHRRAPQRGDPHWVAMANPVFLITIFVAGPYVTFSCHRVPLNTSAPVHIVFLSLHGLAAGTALARTVRPSRRSSSRVSCRQTCPQPVHW